MKPWFESVARSYKTFSLIVVNTIILFGALNLVAWLVGVLTHKPSGERVIREHGMAKLRPAYPHMDERQITELHRETWGRSLVYEPLTEFREPASGGKYVNVSAEGFRRHEGGPPWPPATNHLVIFVFGGSTTFGYGVADDETIPARVQARARKLKAGGRFVTVYNFGRGFYTSNQERILFEKLILGGDAPHIAVFIDGINEPVFPSEHTELSVDLENAVRLRNGESWNLGIFQRLPLLALFPRSQEDKRSLAQAQEASLHRQYRGEAPLSYDVASGVICRRYLNSIRMIDAVSKAYQVRPLFVWQPASAYNFDVARHPFGVDPNHHSIPYVYQRMDGLRGTSGAPKYFLWLADIQIGRTEPLYVDAVHYSAHFSDLIAGEIVGRLDSLGWLD